MGNVNMEASQIHYRGGNRPMSVEEAIKEGSSTFNPEVIAPEFSATAQYLEGDLAFYEGKLYRFEVDHDPGAWDSTEVMETTIAENLVMFPGDGLRRTVHTYDVKLQVGGGLAFDENGALYTNIVHNYSTTEQPTGQKWIDGKDIYFKTLNVGALPSTGSVTIAHGITDFGHVVNVETVGISGDGYSFANNGLILNSASASSCVFSVTFDATGYNGYATVYYTKSE